LPLFTLPQVHRQRSWQQHHYRSENFEHPEAKHFATCFCRNCGSSLPWMSQSGISVVIPAGTLDEDPGIRPTQNIFWKSCAPWREEVSSLPHYDELPPRKDKS
jgi:hypothetical protein